MLSPSRKTLGIPPNRIPRLTAAAVPAAVLVLMPVIWMIDNAGNPEYWRVILVFLTVLETAYIVAAAIVIVAIPLLALLAIRGRRRRQSDDRRPRAAACRLARDQPDPGRSDRRGVVATCAVIDRRPGRRPGARGSHRSAGDVAAALPRRGQAARAVPQPARRPRSRPGRRGRIERAGRPLQRVALDRPDRLMAALGGDHATSFPGPCAGQRGRHAGAPA